MSGTPNNHDEHDLDLPSDGVREIAHAAAPGINPEQIAPSEVGKLNPTTEATDSTALEPHMDLPSHDVYVTGTPDSSPAISSEPCEFADVELDRLSIT